MPYDAPFTYHEPPYRLLPRVLSFCLLELLPLCMYLWDSSILDSLHMYLFLWCFKGFCIAFRPVDTLRHSCSIGDPRISGWLYYKV